MEVKYEDILKDKDLIRIFKNNYYKKVYDLLGNFVLRYNLDFKERFRLRDKLFIEYMKIMTLKNRSKYIYERILVGMFENPSFKNIVIYILNSDIDFSYEIIDKNYKKVSLVKLLAKKIKDKDIMRNLLQRIEKLEIDCSKESIDLCQMNIIAGNLNTAFKIFNDDTYLLLNSKLDIVRLLKENGQIKLDDFDYTSDDILFQIILTIKESNLEEIEKKKILVAIFKSKKVKLLNTLTIKIIEDILGEKTMEQFLEYISDLEQKKEIILYTISPNDKKVIFLDNLETTIERLNVKKMIKS